MVNDGTVCQHHNFSASNPSLSLSVQIEGVEFFALMLAEVLCVAHEGDMEHGTGAASRCGWAAPGVMVQARGRGEERHRVVMVHHF
jgi:hypothetical protein